MGLGEDNNGIIVKIIIPMQQGCCCQVFVSGLCHRFLWIAIIISYGFRQIRTKYNDVVTHYIMFPFLSNIKVRSYFLMSKKKKKRAVLFLRDFCVFL